MQPYCEFKPCLLAALHSLLPRGRGKASCNAIGQHADDSKPTLTRSLESMMWWSARSHRRSVGLFGTVYKAMAEGGDTVAVRCLAARC